MISFYKKNIVSIICLMAIILIGTILRFNLLGINPPSLNWDEASIGYNAYSILKTGADEYGNVLPLSFRSFGDYKPPLYVYLTVPTVLLFGLNEFAIRFPAAIIGVLAVLLVYFFVKEILKNWDVRIVEPIALLAALFMAISPWHLQFSRAAYEGNIGIFFLILAVYCFFKAFKDKRFFVLFAASFVLSLYSYHSFRLINPIILLALTAFYYKEVIKQKTFFVLSVATIMIFSFPVYSSFFVRQETGARLLMVTIFSDPQIRKMSAEKVLEAKQQGDFLGQIFYNRRVVFIPTIILGYFDHFNFDFLFLHGDSGVQHHAYNMGMLYVWDFPFILLGLYFLLKKLDKRILILLIIFFFAPVPSSITTGTPHPVRAIAMIPAFHIFAAVGVVYGLKLINKFKKPAIVIVSILLLINIIYYLRSYYVLTPIHYGYFWQYGNKEAIEYARQTENEYKKIVMTYRIDQPYIYYLFYNKIDPFWYQKNWADKGNIGRFERKIGKYEFRYIDFNKDSKNKNTLLIGTADEIPYGAKVIKEIKYLDGSVVYKIVKI